MRKLSLFILNGIWRWTPYFVQIRIRNILSLLSIWDLTWHTIMSEDYDTTTTLSLGAQCGAELRIKIHGWCNPLSARDAPLEISIYFRTWTFKISTILEDLQNLKKTSLGWAATSLAKSYPLALGGAGNYAVITVSYIISKLLINLLLAMLPARDYQVSFLLSQQLTKLVANSLCLLISPSSHHFLQNCVPTLASSSFPLATVYLIISVSMIISVKMKISVSMIVSV